MFYRCLFLMLALAICPPNLAGAANPKDARNLAILMGYAGACSQKILGVDHDAEAAPFAKKAFAPYVSMGSDLLKLVNASIASGIKTMQKTDGKYCPAVLRTIISRYETLGFSANIYKKALTRLGNTGMPKGKSGKAAFNIKIIPGHYIAQNSPNDEIFLNQDGTGRISGSFSSRLKWEAAGFQLNIFFVDDNNYRSRLARAKILKDNYFELEGKKYQLESETKIDAYSYKENGLSGVLRLQKQSAQSAEIGLEIETVNNNTSSSCIVKARCKKVNDNLICYPLDQEQINSQKIIIHNYSARQISVESTLPTENFCSKDVNFTGKYIRKNK